VTAAAAP
jgi:hypothetical protein